MSRKKWLLSVYVQEYFGHTDGRGDVRGHWNSGVDDLGGEQSQNQVLANWPSDSLKFYKLGK